MFKRLGWGNLNRTNGRKGRTQEPFKNIQLRVHLADFQAWVLPILRKHLPFLHSLVCPSLFLGCSVLCPFQGMTLIICYTTKHQHSTWEWEARAAEGPSVWSHCDPQNRASPSHLGLCVTTSTPFLSFKHKRMEEEAFRASCSGSMPGHCPSAVGRFDLKFIYGLLPFTSPHGVKK